MSDFYKENSSYLKLKRILILLKKWDLLELLCEVILDARMDAIDGVIEKLKERK